MKKLVVLLVALGLVAALGAGAFVVSNEKSDIEMAYKPGIGG
ncbi:hypothetical protein [Metabacillus arenae]|nr:hypothetical protein [Metabacillus arenae]